MLSRESNLAPVFHPFLPMSVRKNTFLGCSGRVAASVISQNMPPGILKRQEKICRGPPTGQIPSNVVTSFKLFQPFSLRPPKTPCNCVFVFVYLNVRHSGTLILRCLYHNLVKNIAHDRPICNFDKSCICIFVYMYLCIWSSKTLLR